MISFPQFPAYTKEDRLKPQKGFKFDTKVNFFRVHLIDEKRLKD